MYHPIQKILGAYSSFKKSYQENSAILKKMDKDFEKSISNYIENEMPKHSSEVVPESIGERFFKSFEEFQKKRLESLV